MPTVVCVNGLLNNDFEKAWMVSMVVAIKVGVVNVTEDIQQFGRQ